MYATKFSKITLVFGIAFFMSIVALNNMLDYNSNLAFVKHVLSMDTTFSANALMGRAITSPIIHHIFYILIIATESLVAILCWIGGFKLLSAIKSNDKFNKAKSLAVFGITIGMILFFVGFLSIGGEWFLMWQSKIWNGQQAAFRIITIFGIILVYLNSLDKD